MEQIQQTQQTQEKEIYPTTVSEGKKHNYSFWKNKPVIKFNDIPTQSTNIQNKSNILQKQVYGTNQIALPSGFKWVEVDITNNINIQNISTFLKKYYLVDASDTFKLNYTMDFLKWAFNETDIVLTIVSEKNNSLCGIISATFKKMRVFEATQTFALVNFLCVHPIYRGKKMVCALIDEISRRSVQKGIYQGCFTTERCIPTPITTLRYYHRPFNYLKLFELGFTDLESEKLPNKKDPERVQKLVNVIGEIPKNYLIMEEKHINSILKIYNNYIQRHNIYVYYRVDDLKRMLLNNEIVKSYVILDSNGNVVDFVSYYVLNSFSESSENNIINEIYAGYLFLYTCNVIRPSDFVSNILKIASYNGLDVFNVVDSQIISDELFTHDNSEEYDSDEESFRKQYNHGFLKGTGKIHFNFFNWQCPKLHPRQISLVVL